MLNSHFGGGEVSIILGILSWKIVSLVADSWGVWVSGSTAGPSACKFMDLWHGSLKVFLTVGHSL